ncbi:hypothetical protein DFH29DRAFT_1002367 [Suillus ampliporus]|nr:hypothetical protein DFH29DRAFT_1002367 [Suillus ampliporus]
MISSRQDVPPDGFFSPHPDEDPTNSAVESYSLQELHPVHTYPPTPQPASTMIHTRPLEPTSLGEDFTMALYKPLVALRRMREEEDERPNKVVLKEMDHSSGLCDDVQKDALYQREILVAREKQWADNEMELTRLAAEYGSKIASLNNQIRQATLVGKRPAATCPNILGFSPIPDVRSESLADQEPQTSTSGNVGMLAEALHKALQVQQTPSPRGPHSRRKIADPPVEYFTDAQHRENKVNVRDLFKEVFHFTKDDEYILHEGASRETISFFIGDMGPSPDPLALQWDMTTTHKLDGTKRCWRKACPQVLSDGTRKTMRQVGDRLMDHTNERLRMARVLSHRTTKFKTRQKLTSALLSDRKVTGKEDLPVWVYLNSIVETLNKDGMSSDESEDEDCGVPVFQLKTMPWRDNFSHEMQIIDKQRAGCSRLHSKGKQARKASSQCQARVYSASSRGST